MNGPGSWNSKVFNVPNNPVINSRVPVRNVVGSSNLGMREVGPSQLATETMKQRVGAAQNRMQTFQDSRGRQPGDMSSFNMFALGAVALFLALMYMRSQ